jgi:hypothetical protein
VLTVSNRPNVARFTGLCAGLLVATFITVEAPLSGMSMNPARTVGSAFWAHDWTALWVYLAAPPLGMLAAAELHIRRRGTAGTFCAKLHHQNEKRCIFCEYQGRGLNGVSGPRTSVSGERGMVPSPASHSERSEESGGLTSPPRTRTDVTRADPSRSLS